MPKDRHRNGSRVRLEVTLRNRLPASLVEMYRDKGDEVSTKSWQREANAADHNAVRLKQIVWLPDVPQVGESIEVNANFDLVTVADLHWVVQPIEGGEPLAVLQLTELDEDYVGAGALDLLLDAGWVHDDD